MSSSTICVVGTDATMVYDALHNVLQTALGDLDPSFALQDFTAKDAASSSSDSILSRVIEALGVQCFNDPRKN